MKPLIPVLAKGGLIVVAITPAPGLMGVVVGGCCVALILGWTLARVFQAAWVRTLAPITAALRSHFRARRRRREFHMSSGLAKKVRTAKP